MWVVKQLSLRCNLMNALSNNMFWPVMAIMQVNTTTQSVQATMHTQQISQYGYGTGMAAV